MEFTLNIQQGIKLADWFKEHNNTCKFYDNGTLAESPSGAIGGAITYCFTPTSIGMIQIVECACGAKIDLTEYDVW